MIIKKSIISIIAASAILGLTGCGDETSNSVEENISAPLSGPTNRISDAKGSVTGTVMDTNGNPISDVSVSVAGKTTKTNAAGIYLFADVPVTSTVNANGAGVVGNALSVTISAPSGYLGATVTVTPQAQQISSEDGAAATTGQTNPNTNFIDGYIASAGTAVLPKLGAKVTGRLELLNSEQALANQEISLDFVNIGGNIAQVQDGVVTTYATGNYVVMTDANGTFTFENLPEDSILTYVVPNYSAPTEQTPQGIATSVNTGSETSLINVGDVQVTPVIQSDNAAPYVTSVTGTIGNVGIPQMMEDDVRQTFVINFSEAMMIENDSDFTDSVIVKAGRTRATMTTVAASATIGADGKSVTVTLDNALTDATLLDINLLVSDYKDAAGNFLRVSVAADANDVLYDTTAVNTGNTQVVALQLQIFNDLNTNAPQITVLTQEKLDENGIDDAALLQAANSAFNDVIDSGLPDNTISQMNSRDDDDNSLVSDTAERLSALGTASLGAPVTMETNVARVHFTPTNAGSYLLALTRAGAPVAIQGNFALQGGASTGIITNTGLTDVIFTPADVTDTTPVELAVLTATNARPGDVLTITPRDELGYAGTAQTITFVDNVEPTTVLQRAYGLGDNTSASSTVVLFGAGGELSGNSGSASAGTPILNITAGLLDNLSATGAAVTGVAPYVSDNTLDQELSALSTAFDHDANPATPNQTLFASGTNVYDTVAYQAMNRTRTIGVAFSEDVDLNGTTPTVSNISDTLTGWKANNDVIRDDDGVAVNLDLIDFVSANVETLANVDAGGVIDFTGVVDNAGNAASAAANPKVVLADRMPPLVTKASFTGSDVVIEFNEAVRLTTGATVTISGKTATYAAGNTNYVLSNANKTLTINVSEFAGVLARADFALGSYVETAYDTVTHQHASMSWTIQDTHGNNWLTTNAGVAAPAFAAVDLVGPFSANTPTFTRTTSATVATIVWTFTHPIDLTAAGTEGPDLSTALASQSVDDINALFDDFAGVNPTTVETVGGTDPAISLSSDNKTITLVIGTDNDFFANENLAFELPFQSAVDAAASVNVQATAN